MLFFDTPRWRRSRHVWLPRGKRSTSETPIAPTPRFERSADRYDGKRFPRARRKPNLANRRRGTRRIGWNSISAFSSHQRPPSEFGIFIPIPGQTHLFGNNLPPPTSIKQTFYSAVTLVLCLPMSGLSQPRFRRTGEMELPESWQQQPPNYPGKRKRCRRAF